jgi:hypothetical protein
MLINKSKKLQEKTENLRLERPVRAANQVRGRGKPRLLVCGSATQGETGILPACPRNTRFFPKTGFECSSSRFTARTRVIEVKNRAFFCWRRQTALSNQAA